MVFGDRNKAGEVLADTILQRYKGTLISPVVVAIPRGGVVVAEPVAEALNAPLTLVFPRKIGAPFNEEYAIGAVTESGYVLINPDISEDVALQLGITKEYLQKKAREEMEEIKRRKEKFKIKDVDFKGRDLILVDDGIATGLTVKAAIMELKSKKPNRVILAVPVMPAEKVKEFERLVDELVVLYPAPFFRAVGQFYSDFPQTPDGEVIDILEKFGNR